LIEISFLLGLALEMDNNKRRRIIAVAMVSTIGVMVVAASKQAFSDKYRQSCPWFTEEELTDSPALLVQRITLSTNPHRCKTMFRISVAQFARLCEILTNIIPTTTLLTLEVQLAIFLDWISTGKSIRCQHEFWKILHEAIVICRRQVADGIFKELWPMYVVQPSEIPNLTTFPKLRHFQGAFGCIDGCHIPIVAIRESSTEKSKGLLVNECYGSL
jgi:hypothetical protein